MLRWSIMFLVVALVAGALGFGGVAGTSLSIAKVLFGVFLAGFIITALLALFTADRLKTKL